MSPPSSQAAGVGATSRAGSPAAGTSGANRRASSRPAAIALRTHEHHTDRAGDRHDDSADDETAAKSIERRRSMLDNIAHNVWREQSCEGANGIADRQHRAALRNRCDLTDNCMADDI